MEEKTRQEYITHQQEMGHQGLAVDSAGLFVSLENPWLAASPDGLVNDPNDGPHPSGLVEVKTPHSIRKKPLSEACTMPSFCLEKEENDGSIMYRLKRRHDYFYHIQCQLCCTERQWCDFVLRTEKELHVERIDRDTTWWERQLPRLRSFYVDALLPELACPRHCKGGIREPPTMSMQ